MKNVVRTLALALTLGLFLQIQPASAQMLPEPTFKNPNQMSTPVKVETAAPATTVERLEIQTARPQVEKTPAIDGWTAPLTNPTPYNPMMRIDTAPGSAALQATPPIAIPVHLGPAAGDNFTAPAESRGYDPMR
jgi:hypothetical protein